MELPNNPDGAGESNIASSEFNLEGNLRISFHRGSFETQEAQNRSAYSTAYVIGDFLLDTVDSFWRRTSNSSVKTAKEIQILLESTDDDPHFAEMVQEQLYQLNPQVRDQIQIAPSLRNVSESERARYLDAKEMDWDAGQRQSVLNKMSAAGQKLTSFNLVEGFKHVKSAELQAGEKLIEAGAPSAFVYIPLGDGLKIIPLGGYQSFSVTAWMPLGTTGVIRGDIRNADIIAGQRVAVLVVPKEVYLRYWYMPHSPMELKRIIMENQNFEQAKQYALRRLEKELSVGLYYHGLSHTSDDVVLAVANFAKCEAIKGEDLDLLLTAAWFHDLGFIEARAGHEAAGARIALEVLPGFGYSEELVQIAKGIILATLVPPSPKTILEEIMADADLDVLGRDDFMFRNNNLRRELAFFGQDFTDTQWFSGQLKFIESHVYFTATARKLRNEVHAQNVAELKKKLKEVIE